MSEKGILDILKTLKSKGIDITNLEVIHEKCLFNKEKNMRVPKNVDRKMLNNLRDRRNNLKKIANEKNL